MQVGVVKINNKWCFEAKSKKHTYSTEFESKERAEEFLAFYNKYFYKMVRVLGDKDIKEPVKVTEISFRYDNGEQNPPTKVLGIRWKNAKWFVLESNCVLV